MENELQKKEKFAELLLIYGKLLTKNIYHRMEMFYLEDYSITEISELEKVSRNAIFESLSHGEKQLSKYENNLHIGKKNGKITVLLDELANQEDSKKRLEIIEEIKGELGYGIWRII